MEGFGTDIPGLAEYLNIPATVGMAISSGKVTLSELQTSLSVEDLHDILEVISVDIHNRRVVSEWVEKNRERR